MIRCPKCNFFNVGDHPICCSHCGRKFIYHNNYDSYSSHPNRDDDDFTHVGPEGIFVREHDRWNHEEERPNTFVEDAMKYGSSGGGGNTQSFESDKEPEREADPEPEERQDDPDPPTDNNSDD